MELRDSEDNPLAEILRDGYKSPYLPEPGKDLGWKSCSYDLSAFNGQTIKLCLENKNEHDGALGVWTCVDDVKAMESTTYHIYLPIITKDY